MTLGRSRAYGRIIRALDSSAARERMTADQRDALREAADTLVLASAYDHAVRMTLAAARAVLMRARTSDCDHWLEQLADDLEDAGPASPFAVSPGVTGQAAGAAQPNQATPR